MYNQSDRVIGIGETVYDIIFKNNQPQWAVPGGSTFNAIISLGRIGVPCTMVTETGDDYIADLIYKYLSDNGVDGQYVYRHIGSKSHLSLAFLNEENDAQYSFYKDHAQACGKEFDLHPTATDIILFGSFFAINPAIRNHVRNMLMQAHQAGATLYYDVNFRAAHKQDIPNVMPNIQENMQLATIVRGSLEDFEHLYNTNNVDEIYENHIRPYCPYFICTNGAKSIELRTPELLQSFPVQAIETVSTIGAGDNFNAGFIYALRKLRQTQNSISQAKEKDQPLCKLHSNQNKYTPCMSLANQETSTNTNTTPTYSQNSESQTNVNNSTSQAHTGNDTNKTITNIENLIPSKQQPHQENQTNEKEQTPYTSQSTEEKQILCKLHTNQDKQTSHISHPQTNNSTSQAHTGNDTNNRNLKTLPLNEWTGLIETGQRFAQDVCRQFSNSISDELIRSV